MTRRVWVIDVTHFNDPGCPWGYSAGPALATLRFRYGDQLRWRLVMIGICEDPEQRLRIGYTPAGTAMGHLAYARWGMPFTTEPRERVIATARACRAVVATRL